jgi:membrane-associated phospholipid phosphatase
MSAFRWVVLGLVSMGCAHFTFAQGDSQDSSGSTVATPQPSVPAGNVTGLNGKRTMKAPPVFGMADDTKYELSPGEDPDNHVGFSLVKHLASDQMAFWTAPARFRKKDLEWIVPFAGVTTMFIASDSWISKQIPLSHVDTSKTISDYGVYSMIAAGAGSFVFGHLTSDDRMSEAGLLSGEAALNSTAVAYVTKVITQRPRPYQDHGNGTFFQGGSSFPSEHAAIAWSVASVMAHEYPGTLTQILAYGLATTISATRVTAQQHFASDVIVGSALGWYFGRQVYRAHHDTSLGGAPWGDLLPESSGEKTRNPDNMGSPYVDLDSWVYPALVRLAALGYIKSAYLGIRPWTRMECARMLEEVAQKIGDEDDPNGEVPRYYRELAQEFASETARLNGAANLGATLDSVYVRTINISGPPLRDGYHFGQTITNDYGRPYAEGFNAIAGFTTHAVAGPLAFYLRGEYQHAPAAASAPMSVLKAIANADLTTPVSNARSEVNRFDLLEGSVAVTFRNTQISFGKQSQWLGPGESGALLMSNNAEPLLMLKLDTVSPCRIPLLSSLLGPVRMEYFLGQLAGHQFELNGNQLLGPGGISPQPFLDGGKFSFKPTSNLELGAGFTAQFAGPGLPFTFGNFIPTFYYHTQTTSTTSGNNPAKRSGSADFSYRVPGVRNWLTVYGDFLTVDEISPIGSTRATVNPGIYVSQFPKLHKLDFRAEGIHEPLTNEFAPGFVYYGIRRYRSGYTNDGNLMGNWIGRAGRGAQAWLTYFFSPMSRIQAGYRLQEVSRQFVQGGRAADYSAAAEVAVSSQISLRTFLQYERWSFPLLVATAQSNFSAGLQLTFHPELRVRK